MWIRTNDAVCKADEFSRFYIESMPNGYCAILGKESDSISVVLGVYKDCKKSNRVLDNLYSALKYGYHAFTMPKDDYVV